MGLGDILKGFGKVETPDVKGMSGEAQKIRVEFKKTDVNTLPVRYFYKNSPYFIDTIATLHRTTNFTIGILEIPEALGFILAENSIYFDKNTKKEIVHVKEGYPFSLVLTTELNGELETFKLEHPEVKEYVVPIMINQIPLHAIRVKLHHQLPGFPDAVDITQKFIYQISFVKIMDKVNKEKVKGAFVLVLMGFLAGALFMLAATVFFLK